MQRQPKILIIEDDEYSREALVYSLKAEGYETEACADGAAGYEAAEQSAPDLIVLDLVLPDVDGREVLARLRQHPQLHHTPVIIVSGLSAAEAATLGADACLLKPVVFEDLLQAVQKLR